MDDDAGRQSGYAQHLLACPHVNDNIKLEGLMELSQNLVEKCSQCDEKTENWLCLTCHKGFCGRYAKKHMVAHVEEAKHMLACGVRDLSFWCYACDNYVNHLTIPRVFTAYAQLHIKKFNEVPACKPSFPKPAAVGSQTQTTSSQSSNSNNSSNSTNNASSKKDENKMDTKSDKSDVNDLMLEGLTKEQMQLPIVDKILGCIYGNCLGDAYGLATEFMDKAEVLEEYGDKPNIPFPDFSRNHHNSRWVKGDWTDDSDQMILIIECLLEGKGTLSETLFAQKLVNWIKRGFPELGDWGGMGLGMTVGMVCSHNQFLSEPHEASEAVWEKLNRNAAANGAVMRTSVLGCYQYQNMDKVIENTDKIARVTHHDPRCRASCVAITSIIARILQGKPCGTSDECEALIKEAYDLACKHVTDKDQKAIMTEYFNHKNVEAMKLDEKNAIGFTLKCMACGLYGLRSQKGFKRTLLDVIIEAGDADTNGAVCGAVLGCKLGYSGLPKQWVAAMPHKKWLDKKVVALLKLMGVLDAKDKPSDSSSSSSDRKDDKAGSSMQT